MGNKFMCMSKKEGKNDGIGSRSKRGSSMSRRKTLMEEELLHRQALAMAIREHNHSSQRFENGSISRRIGSTSRRRPANLSDPLSGTGEKQLEELFESIKIKKFVLVHGEGFGAWCWYRSIALLEETGLSPVALDLTGSGINLVDTDSVKTLSEYSKPLLDYLAKLPEDEKVILVGHSTGGACVSYALELFPEKISKAIYLCATMVADCQKTYDVFSQELGSTELFSTKSKSLVYANGYDFPPTSFVLEKHHLRGLYFNNTPVKDVALAMVSMRPIPLCPMMDKLSLSSEKYGKGRRFYIQTLEDNVLSPDVQEKLVRENPPEGVFKIKGSDHCPFFSKPQSLHKILLQIAQIP